MTDAELRATIAILRHRLRDRGLGDVRLSRSWRRPFFEELRTLLADRKAAA
jgi:hypothetical protein